MVTQINTVYSIMDFLKMSNVIIAFIFIALIFKAISITKYKKYDFDLFILIPILYLIGEANIYFRMWNFDLNYYTMTYNHYYLFLILFNIMGFLTIYILTFNLSLNEKVKKYINDMNIGIKKVIDNLKLR